MSIYFKFKLILIIRGTHCMAKYFWNKEQQKESPLSTMSGSELWLDWTVWWYTNKQCKIKISLVHQSFSLNNILFLSHVFVSSVQFFVYPRSCLKIGETGWKKGLCHLVHLKPKKKKMSAGIPSVFIWLKKKKFQNVPQIHYTGSS